MKPKYIIKDFYPVTYSDMGYLKPIFNNKGEWVADEIISKAEWDERNKK